MPPSAHPSTVLAPFQSLFSAPTWRKVQCLIIGTLLACGRRTVTAALRHTGQSDTPAFSLYHQVFNRARWSALKGSRRLLSLLVQTFGATGGSPTFVIDETLERRWGRRINKRGHYRDPLASSRKRSVSTSGLRWIVLSLVVTPPWTTRCWALPIPGSSPGQALSVPAPTPQVSERLGLRHKTIAQWTRQMIRLLRRWLPHVAITVLGDQAYSVVELAHTCRRRGVRLIVPLRLDAVLHEAPPTRQPGTRGRPPLKGRRLPTLAERLGDATMPWQPLCVRWYDGRACDGCKSVAARRYGTAAASHPCRSDGLWSVTLMPSTRHGRISRRLRVTRRVISWRVSSSVGALRRRLRKAAPTWALRPSVSGRTWRLNGPRRVCWACIRWWHCWPMTCTPDQVRGRFWRVAWRYERVPGMARSRRRSATLWQRCGDICGKPSIFQHQRPTPSG